MDRDTESIGGVEKPLQPTRELFRWTVALDLTALVLTLWLGWAISLACLVYIVCSRLYSYRGVRLKKFAFLGYFTVMLNQGGLVFWMVYNGASLSHLCGFPWVQILAAIFLIGGFYPLTQVYQHGADRRDGVTTISMKLGIRGTFVLCGLMYLGAFGLLFFSYRDAGRMRDFLILQIFMFPVIVYFVWWAMRIWKDEAGANYKNTMVMNVLASSCTNIAFLTLLILHSF